MVQYPVMKTGRMNALTKIARALLAWYDRGHRTMPWRGSRDPYAIWVSETMLQQTRVSTVIPYFERFMRDFPTATALAQADPADVMKDWEGLGYYRRAANLQKGARQVCDIHEGKLPADAAALRKISGIGPYTAGAVASIAFGLPEPAVDGNVIRVASRVLGIRENTGIPSVRRALEERVRGLIPAERPGDFNQALMDLGATVCVPGTPSCEACPLADLCDALDAGDAEELPRLPDKTPPKDLAYDVLLIRDGAGRVLMRPRTETLLSGLWGFPMAEGHKPAARLQAAARRITGAVCGRATAAGEAKHVFTHRVWRMRMWLLSASDGNTLRDGWRFVTPAELETLTVPTAFKAACAALRQADTAPGETSARQADTPVKE